VSGGVSNLSFSSAHEPVRRAMHAVFLYHASTGMDLGIVKRRQPHVYDDLPTRYAGPSKTAVHKRSARRRTHGDRGELSRRAPRRPGRPGLAFLPCQSGCEHALVEGILDTSRADTEEARKSLPRAIEVIEGPLMAAERGRRLVRRGNMFRRKVVKSARVMRRLWPILVP